MNSGTIPAISCGWRLAWLVRQPPGGPATGTGAIDPNRTSDGAVAGARADQDNIIVDGIDASDFAGGLAFTTTGVHSRRGNSGIQHRK